MQPHFVQRYSLILFQYYVKSYLSPTVVMLDSNVTATSIFDEYCPNFVELVAPLQVIYSVVCYKSLAEIFALYTVAATVHALDTKLIIVGTSVIGWQNYQRSI